MTDMEEAKVVTDTKGIEWVVLPSDTRLAKTLAEMCEDYTKESALSENELRISIYRAEAVKAERERLENAIDDWGCQHDHPNILQEVKSILSDGKGAIHE